MEHKLQQLIELTDVELDVVSGGRGVGIQQRQNGGNISARSGSGNGAATNNDFSNFVTQTQTNSGSVTNFGAVG
jgi:hypothetical protein